MKIKKYIWLLVLCFIMISSVGCGTEDIGNKEDPIVVPAMELEIEPDYIEAKSDFQIGMWVGIPEYKSILDENDIVKGTVAWTDDELDEQYAMIKEAGFTIATTPSGLWSKEHTFKLLELAEKYELKQLVWDIELNEILLNPSISDEEACSKARRILVEYMEYDSFYGNMITDEPNVSEYSNLALGARRYKTVAPDKMYYLNLFPIEATKEQIGANSYVDYLERYKSLGLNYVCYDKYPLKNAPNNRTILSDDFLYNMQLCQNVDGIDEVWTFLQSMGYGTKKDPNCIEDFRIQVNSALAYGIKGIQWFCYFSPLYGGPESFTPAIIALDGSKTEKYDLVKQVNNELNSLANIYNNFAWQRAMNFVGSTNTRNENSAFNYFETNQKHDRIKSFKTEKDTIVGVFKDSDLRDGFMITNYDEPSSKQENNVEIEFRNCTKVLCYVNGEKTSKELVNGKLNLTLKAGDGAFVIPLYLSK